MAQNSKVPRSQDDYITQASQKNEGRVTEKLSQQFSRTENRMLGALARLEDFLTSPLFQGHSGPAPETSRNIFSFNQGTIEDDSQNNPHPGTAFSTNQMTQNSGIEEGHDMVTGVQKESLYRHNTVTGAIEQIRNRHGMTGVHEEVTYCSPSTSSGKQKKNHSTSQPQFRSESIPATIEADQILLALQQLANNNNSANFHNSLNRNSKLAK